MICFKNFVQSLSLGVVPLVEQVQVYTVQNLSFTLLDARRLQVEIVLSTLAVGNAKTEICCVQDRCLQSEEWEHSNKVQGSVQAEVLLEFLS